QVKTVSDEHVQARADLRVARDGSDLSRARLAAAGAGSCAAQPGRDRHNQHHESSVHSRFLAFLILCVGACAPAMAPVAEEGLPPEAARMSEWSTGALL